MSRTALESRRAFAEGTVTATELVETCLNTIERHDAKLNVFLTVADEQARRQAADLDRRRAAKEPLGPLAGVCVAVKDLISTRDIRTTCGSRILEKYTPVFDATVIDRLKQADAIVVGKTNLDEFGMGSSNENSAYGRVANPWDLDRVTGGSSGGAAAVVAADFVPLSLGTDTGGSIRQPAAFCGVVGLKPTYGSVSRYGMVAYASSLEQIGPMARTAADCRAALDVLAGHDDKDSTCSRTPLKDSSWNQSLKGLRVGWVEEHWTDGISEGIAAALRSTREWLEGQGATFVPVSLPHARYGIAAYYLLASSEASSNLARFDGAHYGLRANVKAEGRSGNGLEQMYSQSREAGLGPEVKRRILLGTFALSAGYAEAFYGKASRVRRAIQQDFLEAFQDVDVILGPTTPTEPFRAGEKVDDPLAMYLADVFTVLANLAGLPAISFPVGFTEHPLPLGAQLIGRPFEDRALLDIVERFQDDTDWHLRRPSSLNS